MNKFNPNGKTSYPSIPPVHASWLNQVEIYFSIAQRKVLTLNDFDSLLALEDRLIRFQMYYETIAKPFEWKFTRADLDQIMKKIKPAATPLCAAAWSRGYVATFTHQTTK